MLLVNPLHSPLEIMLFSSGALIGLTVVTQAANLGRLITRHLLEAGSRNTAASGSQQIGDGYAAIANDALLVPWRAEHFRKDLSLFPESVPSKEASGHAQAKRHSRRHQGQ